MKPTKAELKDFSKQGLFWHEGKLVTKILSPRKYQIETRVKNRWVKVRKFFKIKREALDWGRWNYRSIENTNWRVVNLSSALANVTNKTI